MGEKEEENEVVVNKLLNSHEIFAESWFTVEPGHDFTSKITTVAFDYILTKNNQINKH